MALFTYDFTGTAGTKLATVSGWSKLGSGFDANGPELNGSGQLRAPADPTDVAMIGRAQTSADQYAQAKVYAGFAYNGTGLRSLICVRTSGRGEYWGAGYNSAEGVWEIFSPFGRSGTYSATLVDGDVCRIEAEGTTVRVYINGTLRMTDTGASAYATNLNVGVLVRDRPSASPVMDDWESGELSANAAPTLTGVITEVSKTANSISISWPAGADDVAVTSYEVSNNGGSSYTDVGNVLTYAFTSLSPSTAYALRVRAKDGASLVSTPPLSTSITTLAADTTNPAFPGGTTLGFTTKTSTSVALSASADATDNIAVTGYEWSSDGGATYPFTSLTRSFTFTALSPLTLYNFRVRGYDGAGLKTAALSLATSTYRAGDTGQNIFDNTGPVGGNPEGFLRNKVTLPADAAKWFSYVITTPPATGSFSTLNPNGTFVFTGPNSETMLVQLEVDGANFGSPFIVSLYDSTSQVATPGNVTSVVTVTPSACTQGFMATPGPVTSLVSVTPSACTQSLTAAVVLPLNLTSAVSVSPSFVRVLTLDPSANRLRMPADGNTRRYLGKFFKRPVEMDDYDIEAADYLATVEDTLISAEVTADPGITVDAFRLVGSFVKVWVSGGVRRGRYKLTVRVTTAEGRIKELKFMVVMPAG